MQLLLLELSEPEPMLLVVPSWPVPERPEVQLLAELWLVLEPLPGDSELDLVPEPPEPRRLEVQRPVEPWRAAGLPASSDAAPEPSSRRRSSDETRFVGLPLHWLKLRLKRHSKITPAHLVSD